MTVYVELTTDAFEEVLNEQKSKKSRGGRTGGAGRRVARRPTRGLEVKDDTAAAFKVILADGSELPLVDSSSPDGQTSSGYANFILQSVQEQRMEKHQIVETFGANYVFFFGESPRFLSVQSVLINSHDFNWEAEWWENYENYLRGTKLVELGGRLYMFYDDNIVEGYMLNATAVKVAAEPFLIQMSFTLFVTDYQNVSFVGDPQFPIRASTAIPAGAELAGPNDGRDLNNKYYGLGLAAINNDAAGPTGSDLAQSMAGESFGGGRRLSAFLRRVPATYAIAPDVQQILDNLPDRDESLRLTKMALRVGAPLRGLIASNLDEYIGQAGSAYFGFEPGHQLPNALSPIIRSQEESDDLFKQSIDFLACYGAGIDNPVALRGLGFMARVDAHAGATFSPKQEQPFGFGLAPSVGRVDDSSRYARDPLGYVYGRGDSRTQQTDNRFVQGAGPSYYGYSSDFAAGPGFGRAGFGDLGGAGFGGALGAGGDPGFKDPRDFTYAGVEDQRSAFERFLKPKKDASQFGTGIGLGASTTGLTGSASFKIGGKVSAFAVVAVGGTLDITGGARSNPQQVSTLQQQRALGHSRSNPFGAKCAVPRGGGLTLSTGGSFGIGGSVGVGASLP